MNKRICFSNPTLLMKRPIAQISEKVNGKVKVFTPRKAFSDKDNSMHYSKLKVDVESYPCFSLGMGFEWPVPICFLPRAWKVLRDNDIIHMWVPFYLSHTMMAVLKKFFFRRKKLILTMDTIPAYSFSMGKFMDFLFKVYFKTFGRIVFSAADEITLYGESFRKYAEKAGVPVKKIRITPTGIDVNVKKSDRDIRKEFGIGKNEKIVLGIGICNNRKGIDNFVKTAEKFKRKDVHFIWVGGGSKLNEFKALNKRLNANIIFTGFRRDVYNFYNQADLFFFPSRGEGLAGVIMEAMVYGLPVVSSDIAGNRDLISNNRNGCLCKKEDVKGYARKINTLLENKKSRDKFISNSKEKIKNKYEWGKNIKGFMRLYE
ncbi:glycosyltransferase family 4 protein [Candidatus Woesearchaeota archaeon]|nr:glycosyltransferase family 4 protein [Candidatus Woesearchaeota archaeon]